MAEVFKVENHPILFMKPRIAEPRSWVKHIPFAYLAIELAQPRLLVELGTHSGNSYLAFCQAVERLGLSTDCVAVDSWKGDDHAQSYGEAVYEALNAYHQPRYAKFSRLMRKYFDDAVDEFADGTIDLLHIDGLHTYDAVKHDFETWLPKLSDRAVVLFHDVAVRERGFGVWKFFEEICDQYPGVSFEHGNGLGMLLVGKDPPIGMVAFIESFRSRPGAYQAFFEALGNEVDASADGGRADLAAVPADCRIYYRAADEEYAEDRQICLSRDRASELSFLRFRLPEGAQVDFLRIDPSESPGVFGLARITLAKKDGALLAEIGGLEKRVVDIGGERLPARGANQIRWVDIGRDPYIELRTEDVFQSVGSDAVFIEVTLSYEAVLEDAAAIRIMDVMASAFAKRKGHAPALAAIESLAAPLDESRRSLAELERRLPLDMAHLGNLMTAMSATGEAALARANETAPEMARTSANTLEAVEGIAALHERIGMESSEILVALATLQHAANGSAQYNLDSRALTESILEHAPALERRVEALDQRVAAISDELRLSSHELQGKLLQLSAEQAPVRNWVERRRWWRWW